MSLNQGSWSQWEERTTTKQHEVQDRALGKTHRKEEKGVCKTRTATGREYKNLEDGRIYLAAVPTAALHLKTLFLKYLLLFSRARFCNPMACRTPGFPVLHHLPEISQTQVHWVDDIIHHLILCHPLFFLLSIFPASEYFPVSWLFTSGGQNIGASASASVLPMNIQGWFPLGLTRLISLLSKGLSRVFSSTTVQKYQFFGTQPTLWSNSHIHTWPPEKT